jgi:antitoxin (DNA-binding transcriptional repressor) of toxin-antitoxin stability system
MTTIRIEEIERDPLGILRKVEAGETLLVIRADEPVAEIRPVTRSPKTTRPFGLCAGKFTVPDDFDDHLPEQILRSFEQP